MNRPSSACVLECGGKRSATPLSNARRRSNSIPLTILTLCLTVCVALGQPSSPVGLLINGVSNPPAIDRDTTRFTWMSADTTRGEKQTAYQILVFEKPASTVIWDSGKMDSDQSASVEYAGKPLPATTRLWWKVRIWDQSGKPGPYSEPVF